MLFAWKQTQGQQKQPEFFLLTSGCLCWIKAVCFQVMLCHNWLKRRGNSCSSTARSSFFAPLQRVRQGFSEETAMAEIFWGERRQVKSKSSHSLASSACLGMTNWRQENKLEHDCKGGGAVCNRWLNNRLHWWTNCTSVLFPSLSWQKNAWILVRKAKRWFPVGTCN